MCDDCNNSNPKLDDCNIDYLKPLSIHKLFLSDECNNYQDVLEKAKKVRNSFFAAKTTVFNYVSDCDDLIDSLQSDLSDNEVELDNVRQNYLSIINNLSSSLYSSLNTCYNGKNLINVDLSKVKLLEARKPQPSNDIKLTIYDKCDAITLTYIPGVTIQLNTDTKLIKLKFSEPEFMSGFNRHGINRKEKDVTTTYILAPSIYCIKPYENYYEDDYDTSLQDEWNHCNVLGSATVNVDETKDVFQNIEITRDFLEEIINYQDNYVIDGENSYGNQILEIMNWFDKTIKKLENVHKYVVQLYKINNNEE